MKNTFVLIVLFSTIVVAFAAGHQQLTVSHIPPEDLQYPLGDINPDKSLHLAITLPVHNRAQEQKFLQDIYNPQSPDYHHYLTPQEFTERFGPSQADYDGVVSFFKNRGFSVTTSRGRALLDINGPAKLVEATFHTTLRRYQRPHENDEFYAPVGVPWVDLDIHLSGVAGLDNFARIHPLGMGELRKG